MSEQTDKLERGSLLDLAIRSFAYQKIARGLLFDIAGRQNVAPADLERAMKVLGDEALARLHAHPDFRAADLARGEAQTCPRRAEGGPGYGAVNADTWETTRWSDAGDKWKWPWRPRTCSYCGGVHPEDALKLLDEGWEIGETTKSYKRYLEVPGTRALYRANFPQGRPRLPGDPLPDPALAARVWHPTPPVKLYTPHLSESHVAAFNAHVDRANAADREPSA